MDFSGWLLLNILGPTLLPVLGTLPSMVVAAGGAFFSTPLPATQLASRSAWISHYRVFVASAAMALVAAAEYIYVHLARGL